MVYWVTEREHFLHADESTIYQSTNIHNNSNDNNNVMMMMIIIVIIVVVVVAAVNGTVRQL